MVEFKAILSKNRLNVINNTTLAIFSNKRLSSKIDNLEVLMIYNKTISSNLKKNLLCIGKKHFLTNNKQL